MLNLIKNVWLKDLTVTNAEHTELISVLLGLSYKVQGCSDPRVLVQSIMELGASYKIWKFVSKLPLLCGFI